MYKLVFRTLSAVILLVGAFIVLSGCEEKKENQKPFMSPTQETTYENVNEKVAGVVAKNFISFMDERFVSAKVVKVQPITGLDGQIEMYAVNFDPKGYVITSADIRNEPIFGFSTENNLPEISFNDISPETEGFLSLLHMSMSFNKWLRDEGENDKGAPSLIVSNANNWENLSRDENNFVLLRVDYIREKLKDKIYFQTGSCKGYTYEKDSTVDDTGILLSTQWGQRKPYNCYTPKNYPVGCVAVAMGQIMRYHRHPQYINWDIMPDSNSYADTIPCDSMTSGYHEMARLLADIGHNIYTLYGSDGSTSLICWARKSLVEDYGYSGDADIEFFDFNRMIRQLRDRRLPLYYSATTTSDFWGLPSLKDGHAFVIDGYKQNARVYTKYEENGPTCSPRKKLVCIDRKEVFIHVNFGWYGGTDGWYNAYWRYLENGKSEPHICWPKGNEYNRVIMCIYDIHP